MMARYFVHFVDHGNNIRATHDIEHDDDEGAIAAAHRLNVLPHMSAGFDVWEDERLVHRHRNSPDAPCVSSITLMENPQWAFRCQFSPSGMSKYSSLNGSFGCLAQRLGQLLPKWASSTPTKTHPFRGQANADRL
jgi:hypothetical protein